MATMKQLVPPLPSGDGQLLNLLVREILERPLDFRNLDLLRQSHLGSFCARYAFVCGVTSYWGIYLRQRSVLK